MLFHKKGFCFFSLQNSVVILSKVFSVVTFFFILDIEYNTALSKSKYYIYFYKINVILYLLFYLVFVYTMDYHFILPGKEEVNL